MSDYELESLFKKDTELLYDKAYIHKVFKRVERVCNASFYIAHKIKYIEKDQTDTLKKNIEDTVIHILQVSSDILQGDTSAFKGHSLALSSALLKLSSLLLLAATAERIPTSHTVLVEHEVATIVSEIADYSRKQHEVRPSRGVVGKPGYTARQTVSPAVSEYQNATGDGQARPTSTSVPSDRKDRIRAIVREKGQVGIKDISDIITDVSEKSIQRDLNDMIEKGEIVRMGERRWSTYRMS